ncbi:MAG: hypothetical protein Crog4KO_06590 [Crocinitomicaceae bacterium]
MKKLSQVPVLDERQYSTPFDHSRKEALLWWYSLNKSGKKKVIESINATENKSVQLDDILTSYLVTHSMNQV